MVRVRGFLFMIGYWLKIVFLIVAICTCFQPEALAGAYIDALKRKVVIDKPPSRIVSLCPSLTEILYFLGLGDRVVGVTRFSNYPKEACSKPKVGSYINLNVEKIISLSPDLLVGTVDGNRRETVTLLDQPGIPVFLVNPRDVMETLETIETLGRLCRVADKARSRTMELRKRIEQVRQKAAYREKPRVFVQINLRPIITVNQNTFVHDLICLAGGINIFGDEPITYPKVSLEEVIVRKPQIIIIATMERGGEFDEARKEWMKWKSIPAVKDKRIHLVDSDLVNRPSPRIVEGLEQMAEFIHP